MKRIFSIVFSICIFSTAHAVVIPKTLSDHADSCEKEMEVSHLKLSNYLASAAQTDEEKVLIFCYWIARNISYNCKEAREQNRTNKTPLEVLSNKKAVCEGYSTLLEQFCENEGITCYTVYGHGYGNVVRRMSNPYHLRHAWNVIYLDGSWKLLDVTWASTQMKRSDFSKTHELSWIFIDPAEFAQTHFPNDPRWQLLKNPLSKREFWGRANTISEKQFALEDSLHVLLNRERYLNELYICKSEFEAQGDEQVYIKNLIRLGWSYVGGSFDSEKVKQGMEIFAYAQAEIERIHPALGKVVYEPNIQKGLQTAEFRLGVKE